MESYNYSALTPASVSDLNDYIQHLIANDEALQAVCVAGEISSLTLHRSGHVYFRLKDEESVIDAVMFRRDALNLSFRPDVGMRVVIFGRVNVYKPTGKYQLYASVMHEDGIGSLALMLQRLKEKLQSEGLFDPSRKKTIPRFPRRIGVVTSPTGAAIHDLINILSRRFPAAEILLYPSLVQGDGASADIARGIRWFSEKNCVDVLIVGRGGGSPEDLAPFSAEEVVRAVAMCNIPTISAVGHESDVALSDFSADLRAPTPSAAAELAVPDREELLQRIADLQFSAIRALQSFVSEKGHCLERMMNSRSMQNPTVMLDDRAERLDRLFDKIINAQDQRLIRENEAFERQLAALNALNPLATMARGYTLSYQDGKILTNASEIRVGDDFSVRFADGTVYAKAESVELLKAQRKRGKRYE